MKTIAKNIAKYVITIGLLVASIYFSFKDIDLKKLTEILKTLDYTWVVITIPIVLISHWVRALRWKTMLKPIMKVNSIMNLFSAVMIGYFFNNIIPRGGEFIRPFIYSRKEKVSFSSLFATILVERVLDVLFLILIFIVVFAFNQSVVNILPHDINPMYIAVIGVIFLIILLSTFFPPVVHFILKLLRPVSEKLYTKLTEIFEKARNGFAIVKKPSQYFRLSFESLLIWVLYALPLYSTFFAFQFQSQLHLDFLDAVMLVIVAGVGVTIAPLPGAIGVYHALIITAMTQLYGISKEEAAAYAIITHFISRMVELITGFIFFQKENIKGSPFSFKINTEEVENTAIEK